jgi:hypothetical protein
MNYRFFSAILPKWQRIVIHLQPLSTILLKVLLNRSLKRIAIDQKLKRPYTTRYVPILRKPDFPGDDVNAPGEKNSATQLLELLLILIVSFAYLLRKLYYEFISAQLIDRAALQHYD